MDILRDTFNATLEREGIDITIGSNVHKVFFRRNESSETIAHNTLYALYGDNIRQGEVFAINGIKYLIIKELTEENSVYRKYNCVKCNATIKWIYAKNDTVTYDCYMKDISVSQLSNSNVVVLDSKLEIWLPLNEDSKRIPLNGRFFCGSFNSVNVVNDMNYLNGICYLYAKRGIITSNDDTDNGIADRWNYETKPNAYTINIAESNIEVEQDATKTLTISVLENGSVMEVQPIVSWNVTDNSICSVDNSNTVTGLTVGTTKITGSYKVNDYDTCVTDNVIVVVKEKAVVVGDIQVSPVYTASTYYNLLLNRTATFTCSISGINNPVWNITLNANGNTSSNYTSTIDNVNGTFAVFNKAKSSYKLIYTITEQTTGKTATYQIALGGIM